MRAAEIISTLHQRNITLKVVNGSLKVCGSERLSAREKVALRAHKGALLRALTAPPIPIDTAKQAATTGATAVTRPSSQAAVNREAMPQIAAAVDQLREVFGPVKVIFAEEAGYRLGTAPVTGKEVRP